MVNLFSIETILHLSVIISLLYPASVSLRISKRISGVLVGMWRPFQLIFMSLIPIAVFHTAEIFLKQETGDIMHGIGEHGSIVVAFLIIGYSFSRMEKIIVDYKILAEKSARTE